MNTLTALHNAGAHLVLCRDKVAVYPRWHKEPASLENVLSWAEKDEQRIGLIPASLGLIVIDVDKNVEAASAQIEEIYGAPLCSVKTRKGRHLYYPEPATSAGNLVWKYGDVRHDRGYVILWEPEAIEAILGSLGEGPIDVSQLPSAPGEERTGGRNIRLWNACFLAGILGDEEAQEKARKQAVSEELPDREIAETAKKGWATGQDARKNKIFPSISALSVKAAINILGVSLRYNTRAKKVETFEKGWTAIDDMREARLFGDIEREFQVHSGKSIVPFKVPVASRKTFLDDLLHDQRIDPFEEWLESLKIWDKRPRLENLLGELLGAEPTPLNRWASQFLVLGAVQRTLEPGCKLDEMVVLIGKQKLGKSALLRNLLPESSYFSDGLNLAGQNKERVESILGSVIVEAAELTGLSRAALDSLKAFISRQDDGSVRLAYRRNQEPTERRCIIVGTTNERQALPNDPTGNRRFVPVSCTKGSNMEAFFAEQRSQIWAEALYKYREGVRANLPWELAEQQARLNEHHRMRDEVLEDLIGKLPQSKGMSLSEIAVRLELSAERISPHRLGRALKQAGWYKSDPKRSRWVSPDDWDGPEEEPF